MKRITRRTFIRAGVYGVTAACLVEGSLIERKWLRTSHLRLSDTPSLRLVHFTDLHYKGDKRYLSRVIQRINNAAPDLACFTGDIVENTTYLSEALDLLSGLQCPLYGIPGNHEYWSQAPFAEIEACFQSTGGDWLPNRAVTTRDNRCLIEGLSGVTRPVQLDTSARLFPEQDAEDESVKTGEIPEGVRRILLTHYPATANRLGTLKYDLILAGHSHGGQVRLPFWGALLVPGDVDGYDAGLYDTPAGPLYVNVGIGTWHIPVRFFCRPEIAIIEL
ncbi:MAG TPA: metallophosphoesterase [Candidatus Hydrogenedentes bacterium]|nr:MAG: putative metallophosphoesterase [Candidatus Hydrogenedentes bacterium ADurb.Bin101]HOC69970.1 metallophosphoesterase [Candidatus Hydrogenedentota bacterium]HQM99752.1 metallophosphoesterase [Candidatus Hydrogenedentota bacterium]